MPRAKAPALPEPVPRERVCIQCGRPGEFRDETALKCVHCDRVYANKRTVYQRDYQRAKSAAIRVLIEKHRKEFETLFRAERMKQRKPRKSA